MIPGGIVQVILYFFILLILVKPLGFYMAQVYLNKPCGLNRLLAPFEEWIYRCCQARPKEEMDWKNYLAAMLILNLIGMLMVYFIQRAQYYLPFNPQSYHAVPPLLAFNIATSFTTNTNWQAYSGETTLSYGTQMFALTVQNFISAATGMSLLMAFIRGLVRRNGQYLGNFWVDTVRGILYILLPLSIILAIALTAQGVIQNLKPNQKIIPFELIQTNNAVEQMIPMGPVASQIAIKQLGTNGGGFFNANAAHPFENPTPLTNFLEMLAILLIPASFCYTYGVMVKKRRQGWILLGAMLILIIPCVCVTLYAEFKGNPALTQLGVDQTHYAYLASGGNMEGKETRFGFINSALWGTVTTASSNGSVNSMHDSFTPLGGLVLMFMMQLGEVVFGGVGSGLYGMLLFVILTVFIAGLMVGRTPEYLGKKIEPYEMKMATIAILIPPLMILIFTAIALINSNALSSITSLGPHGLSEVLYAFTSMANNNGSAFSGLQANTNFYNLWGGVTMLITRYGVAISTLALAGSLVQKKHIPATAGTLPTHTPLFVILLISVIFLIGALSFIPALSLGPIIEQLMIWRDYGH